MVSWLSMFKRDMVFKQIYISRQFMSDFVIVKISSVTFKVMEFVFFTLNRIVYEKFLAQPRNLKQILVSGYLVKSGKCSGLRILLHAFIYCFLKFWYGILWCFIIIPVYLQKEIKKLLIIIIAIVIVLRQKNRIYQSEDVSITWKNYVLIKKFIS